MEARRIPGYGEKYLITRDGKIRRRVDGSWNTYVDVAQWGDPARVTLYRVGYRWQPLVSTVLDRTFGEEND